MIVEEILKDGHANLAAAQLEYVRDMANRVGFTVLESLNSRGPNVVKIRLQISMTDPVFVARLASKQCAPSVASASPSA